MPRRPYRIFLFALLAMAAPCQTPPYVVDLWGGIEEPRLDMSGPAATNTMLMYLRGAVADAAGNVYVAYDSPARIIKVTPGGAFTTLLQRKGSSTFSTINSLAIDAAGNLYFGDSISHTVQKLSPDGAVTIVAGKSRSSGFSGDGGSATSAQLNQPGDVAVDPGGNVYIADVGNNRIRKVTASDGVIRTIAGNGTYGTAGDGGPALSASLHVDAGIAADSQGNVYIADSWASRVRKVTGSTIDTALGTGSPGFDGDGKAPKSTKISYPDGVAVDAQNNLYVSTADNRIRKVTPAGAVTTAAGTGESGFSGDGSAATSARIANPRRLSTDAAGNLYIVEFRRVRKVAAGGTISTAAGSSNGALHGDGGHVSSAFFLGANGVAFDAAGNLYLADMGNYRVRKITPEGMVSTVAGTGVPGYAGDGGQATAAHLDDPGRVAVDRSGNLYVTDEINRRVRKVSVGGTISTFAGNGASAYNVNQGDGVPATSTPLWTPSGMAADDAGNVYIADGMRLRKVSADGIIRDVKGVTGDVAEVTLDKAGNVYATGGNGGYQIFKVTPGGTASLFAGTGKDGYSGDGGPALNANMWPGDLAADSAGNIYFPDFNARRIRMISTDGKIRSVAGNGNDYSKGDGLPALSSYVMPEAIAINSSGHLYFPEDELSGTVLRKMEPGQIFRLGLLNAASFLYGPVAPGELITIFPTPGEQIGPAALAGLQLDASGNVATTLGETRILFDGVPSPLIYTYASQVSAVVPYSVAGKTSTQVQLEYKGKKTNVITLPVGATSPALFTMNSSGTGPAAALNQDYSVNTSANPADKESVVILYGTGEGQTTPAGTDGKPATGVFPAPLAGVSVRIGNRAAEVLYVGAAPYFVAGVLQINVKLPAGLASGNQSVVVTIGGVPSPLGVTIAVK